MGDGLNKNAVTAFDDLLTIQNEGTNRVSLSAKLNDSSSGVVLYEGTYPGIENVGMIENITLDANETGEGESVDVGIAVDTGAETDNIKGTIPDGQTATVTIVAKTN